MELEKLPVVRLTLQADERPSSTNSSPLPVSSRSSSVSREVRLEKLFLVVIILIIFILTIYSPVKLTNLEFQVKQAQNETFKKVGNEWLFG